MAARMSDPGHHPLAPCPLLHPSPPQGVAKSAGSSGSYVQWLYRMYAHLQLQSMGAFGPVPLMDDDDDEADMVVPPLYVPTSSPNITNSGDIQVRGEPAA